MKIASEGRVLVTGASRGIGRAIAERLADGGARVFATGRDESALRELRKPAPERIATFAAELTDPAERKRLLDFGTALWDGLDALVCAAGVARHRAVGDLDESQLRTQLDVNLVAPTMLAADFADRLRAREAPGAIVFVGSTLATRPAPKTAAYAASKAGLHAIARGFALELGPHAIRVNAVAPGVVDTEMIRPLREPVDGALTDDERAAAEAAQREMLEAVSLLGRLGEPGEIAEAVSYLLDAEFVTGEIYRVDGGTVLS